MGWGVGTYVLMMILWYFNTALLQATGIDGEAAILVVGSDLVDKAIKVGVKKSMYMVGSVGGGLFYCPSRDSVHWVAILIWA